MVAGFLGLLLGPSFLAVLPIQTDVLERVVYHGLALMFITVALRSPAQAGATASGVRGFAFGLPLLVLSQAILGLVLVFVWSAAVRPLHPGVGLMVPLGFSQGPGQALALGSAWEATGMEDGAQLGLIMAAMGFVFCVGMGAPLLAVARRLGWVSEVVGEARQAQAEVVPAAAPGGMEPLTRQVAAVAAVYLAAWGVIQLIVWALGDRPQAVATVYGFHFVLGTLLALAARKLLGGMGHGELLSTPLLSRMAALVVDVVTVSAIAAVQLEVIREWWAVVLVFSTLAGTLTAGLSVWVARRAFPDAPFEYALVLFGAATGTLATGLALLRLVDPELRGPVPSGAVLGAAASLPLSIPLLLLLQVPATGWPDSHPGASLTALGVLVVYGVGVAVAWWWWGGFRWLRPALSLWPDRDGLTDRS
jgi:ESS family glutamate:Na+ symporter